MILLKYIHDTLLPICHVVANHEGEVATIDLFEVDQCLWLQLVSEPKRVFIVRDDVMYASEDCNWDRRNGLESDPLSLALFADPVEIVV